MSMENGKYVQLHEIIRNSLATYLSYKWSHDKLYLKKRKKKHRKNDGEIKNRNTALDADHSIINLENDVFIYDAKNKTFTQLDLGDCFRNGLKYRKTDPFEKKPKKTTKYELCEISKDTPEELQQIQNYQLADIEDSVEHIFSNQLVKNSQWGNTVNNLCPSKFNLFIQKELNKYTGRNFNVKSFKINTKQESETPSKSKVCSSAAIGYYTLTTTYDNGLQCDELHSMKGKLRNYNLSSIRNESSNLKKMYSKGLQCKRSNHGHHTQKKEKNFPTNDAGVQCYYAPLHHAEEKAKFDKTVPRIPELLPRSKKTPTTPMRRQNIHSNRKPLKKKHSSLSDLFIQNEFPKARNTMQINSSAEIRKLLDEKNSRSSLNLARTKDYYRAFLNSKPVMTYYQTSSTSKENPGDIFDGKLPKIGPIVVAETSTPGPMIIQHCSSCRLVKQKEPPKTCCCKPKKTGSATKTVVCSPHGPKPFVKQTVATGNTPSRECSCSCNIDKDDCYEKDCCKCEKVPSPVILDGPCICDVICSLRERIRKQTEEQNRNLDQILQEISNQDKELKQIREFVEKHKRKKSECTKKKNKCSCYSATMEYDFTRNLTSSPNLNQKVEQFCHGDSRKITDSEPEIIELFGLDKKSNIKKHKYNVFKKDSWKALWNRNSEVKAFFVNDLFKKRSNGLKKCPSSSYSSSGDITNKKYKKHYKQWFSNLFNSKKDLQKRGS